MKQNIQLLILCALILSLLFTGCARYSPEEKQIREFYEEFIAMDLSDPTSAIEKYVYYKDETIRQVALDSVIGNPVISCRILEIEKISDYLWAIKIRSATRMNPDERIVYNFVAEISGEYKVIRGVRQIPDELMPDQDMDAYLPTGDYIDPEDVFIDYPIRREE